MKPHFDQNNQRDPFAIEFPTLPIIAADQTTRLSTREKYGALFYLGVGGLAILIALIGWFGFNVWTLKSIWINVYALHDVSRPEIERINAAYAIANDPNVNQRQLWDLSLKKDLPPLSRYLLAEKLNAKATEDDPKAYGLAVAKSEGWPDWLRLLLTRPLAYESAAGGFVSADPLRELSAHPNPTVALIAQFALASRLSDDTKSREPIEQQAQIEGPNRPFATLLLKALDTKDREAKEAILDEATLWLRNESEAASAVWKGYKVDGNRIVPVAT